jgi:hypothetical protein
MPGLPRTPVIFSVFDKRRWALLFILSILLHIIVLKWITGSLIVTGYAGTRSSEMAEVESKPVSISLRPPVQAEQPPLAQPQAIPKQRIAKKRPRPEHKAVYASDATPTETAPMPDSVDQPVDGTNLMHEALHESREPPESLTDKVVADTELQIQKQKDTPQAVAYKTSMPPSAELEYDAKAERKGMAYQGSGTINWESNGSQYSITGKAKVLFFTVSEFKSEGSVDFSGILPLRYTERSGNKASADTHFDQNLNTISFSSSTVSYLADGNPQDRASIIWQLAAIGRGTPELFKPATELEIFVAGIRNAEPWRIRIIDEEIIEFGGQRFKTWHIKSVRQKDSREKTIDVWFASEHEWYPVKLRHTEVNGDYLELTLTNLTVANR